MKSLEKLKRELERLELNYPTFHKDRIKVLKQKIKEHENKNENK